MNRKNRKSGILTWVTIGILLLSLSGGIHTYYLTYKISGDAEMINQLGIIRGSIQRLVKLEISGLENDEMMVRIHDRVQNLVGEKESKYKEDKQICYDIDALSENWNSLLESISLYRLNPTESRKDTLIIISEDIWEIANNMVNSSQLLSERRVESYRFTYVFTALHFVLAVIVIFLIQRYVKKNLERQVDYDALTQLHSRSYFDESLLNELAKAGKSQAGFSLILFDIDRFKRINDTFGHGAGDLVLKELSDLIASLTRENDVLSRIGGEEFSLIVPDTDLEKARGMAERIRQAVEAYEFTGVGKVTISLGVTEYRNMDDYKSILKRSDTALYKAKNLGRNKCEIETAVPAFQF